MNLEASAIAALANAAAVDLKSAQACADEHDINPEDFVSPDFGRVWGVVRAMLGEGVIPDLFAVERNLPGIARPVLVEALLSTDARHPNEMLKTLADVAQRRRISKALDRVRGIANDTTVPLAAAVGEAQRALESVQQRVATSRSSEADVLALVDHLEAVARGDVEPALQTGVAQLDQLTGGLQKTLTVIGSLPGVGKSALLASILRNLGARGVKVGLFSLEDQRDWVAKRVTADVCQIPLFVLQTRPLSFGQRQRLQDGSPEVYALMRNIIIDDRPAVTCAEVVSGARQMIVRHNVKALVVDHLGEIRVKRSERHDLDISEVLQQLRALAKMYGVPVVVACHLKRGSDDVPKLTDFAFSAGVERMARVALALTRTAGDDQLRVHILKQTNGQSGVSFDLEFHKLAGMVRNGEATPQPEQE